MMEVFLHDILDEGLDLSFEADPAQMELVEEGVGFEGSIHVQLSVSKQEDTVFITGLAKAKLLLECSLCLKKFPLPLSLGIQAEYLSEKTLGGKEEHELKPEELDVAFYTGDSIQFDDVIREQIILAIPMYPRCFPACRGLCPSCGQDLNAGDCGCAQVKPDARFSALKDYFKDHRR